MEIQGYIPFFLKNANKNFYFLQAIIWKEVRINVWPSHAERYVKNIKFNWRNNNFPHFIQIQS